MKTVSREISWFRILFSVLVACYLVGLLGLAWWGKGYYLTSFSERLQHPDHILLKPSGSVGHSLGVLGTSMMLLSFLYSVRKRWSFLQRFGNQKQWLQFHIFLGLGGPALVVFHTTGKLSGIAAIAFYCTMSMVISGMIGRYLYSKIPRTRKGSELSLRQIEGQLESWAGSVQEGASKEEMLRAVEGYLSGIRRRSAGVFGTLLHTLLDDLGTPFNFYQAWKIAQLQPVSLRSRLRTSRFILKQRRLLKHLAVLEASQRLFSFWHIFHRPFTVLASVVLLAHVAVAVYFGYGVRW